MIIDILSNAEKYFCMNPFFKKAFEYLQSINLDEIEDGNYEVDGDNIRAIVTNKPGKSVEESLTKFECHNKHIDIQFCIKGKEQIGWKPRQSCINQKSEYDKQKDVTFYNDAPDMFFTLTNQQFAVFFPEDVHAPMIGNEKIKKVVIKVKI
ncbi:MAG TPA: YhcH/YjgK/YiaL family protein [Hanamia sp.]|nr:YhcH/YjgK/YiaL family protein [Hanamia sp.]